MKYKFKINSMEKSACIQEPNEIQTYRSCEGHFPPDFGRQPGRSFRWTLSRYNDSVNEAGQVSPNRLQVPTVWQPWQKILNFRLNLNLANVTRIWVNGFFPVCGTFEKLYFEIESNKII